MILNSAEMRVVIQESRPSVPYGANFL